MSLKIDMKPFYPYLTPNQTHRVLLVGYAIIIDKWASPYGTAQAQ